MSFDRSMFVIARHRTCPTKAAYSATLIWLPLLFSTANRTQLSSCQADRAHVTHDTRLQNINRATVRCQREPARQNQRAQRNDRIHEGPRRRVVLHRHRNRRMVAQAKLFRKTRAAAHGRGFLIRTSHRADAELNRHPRRLLTCRSTPELRFPLFDLFHFIFFITTACNFSRALQLLDLGKSDTGHFL